MIPFFIIVGGAAFLFWLKVRHPHTYACRARRCYREFSTRADRDRHYVRAHLS